MRTIVNEGTDREHTSIEYADGSAYSIDVFDNQAEGYGYSVERLVGRVDGSIGYAAVDADTGCASRAEALRMARKAVTADHRAKGQ